MPLAEVCSSYEPIPRVSAATLSVADFQDLYFSKAKAVIITDGIDHWPARKWTIESLIERVGSNQVWIRCQTDHEEYQVGKRYSVRKDTFESYCRDLLAENEIAASSYLAVASLQQYLPQLRDDVPLPEYMTVNGKIHLGPYLWLAMKGHYEFCHFDPDDNFLVMIRGRKQVRLFGHDLDNLYPNPQGALGKTVQSQVNCDRPDLERFPNFRRASCQYCVLEPGEMLFIPAFFWHQVSALESGISVNIFYGDAGETNFLEKILREPYLPHFRYWLLNVIQQNRTVGSFPRMLARMPEALHHFFVKQWHEFASDEQISRVMVMVMDYLGITELPVMQDKCKFPPVMKIRGLLHRGDPSDKNGQKNNSK